MVIREKVLQLLHPVWGRAEKETFRETHHGGSEKEYETPSI